VISLYLEAEPGINLDLTNETKSKCFNRKESKKQTKTMFAYWDLPSLAYHRIPKTIEPA
jgi:hypothetical protein